MTEGAMGIVLDQSTTLYIYELLDASIIDNKNTALQSIHIHASGPVGIDRDFILHDCEVEQASTLQITNKLFLTSSNDILEEIVQGNGAKNKLVVLGYAGWSPGQLKYEISKNSWLTTDYQHELVFDTPVGQQWLATDDLLGVDLNLLSSQPGHA